MARSLSPERRRLVVLNGGVAASSAILPTLHSHPRFGVVCMMLQAGVLGYAVWKMIELRRSGKWCSR